MALAKGRTNNPNGRPPTGRALTEILMREMSKSVDTGKTRVLAKRLTAQAIRDLLVRGEAVLVGGKKIELGSAMYVELIKWFYGHVDGSRQEIKQDAETLVKFVYDDDNGDDDTDKNT